MDNQGQMLNKLSGFKKGRVFEYWPTTQKWWDRKNNKRSRGVDRLLKELESLKLATL